MRAFGGGEGGGRSGTRQAPCRRTSCQSVPGFFTMPMGSHSWLRITRIRCCPFILETSAGRLSEIICLPFRPDQQLTENRKTDRKLRAAIVRHNDDVPLCRPQLPTVTKRRSPNAASHPLDLCTARSIPSIAVLIYRLAGCQEYKPPPPPRARALLSLLLSLLLFLPSPSPHAFVSTICSPPTRA